jgi:hypothetical protein
MATDPVPSLIISKVQRPLRPLDSRGFITITVGVIESANFWRTQLLGFVRKTIAGHVIVISPEERQSRELEISGFNLNRCPSFLFFSSFFGKSTRG